MKNVEILKKILKVEVLTSMIVEEGLSMSFNLNLSKLGFLKSVPKNTKCN